MKSLQGPRRHQPPRRNVSEISKKSKQWSRRPKAKRRPQRPLGDRRVSGEGERIIPTPKRKKQRMMRCF